MDEDQRRRSWIEHFAGDEQVRFAIAAGFAVMLAAVGLGFGTWLGDWNWRIDTPTEKRFRICMEHAREYAACAPLLDKR